MRTASQVFPLFASCRVSEFAVAVPISDGVTVGGFWPVLLALAGSDHLAGPTFIVDCAMAQI
jgi:hypothetical protein